MGKHWHLLLILTLVALFPLILVVLEVVFVLEMVEVELGEVEDVEEVVEPFPELCFDLGHLIRPKFRGAAAGFSAASYFFCLSLVE